MKLREHFILHPGQIGKGCLGHVEFKIAQREAPFFDDSGRGLNESRPFFNCISERLMVIKGARPSSRQSRIC
jgi:hypothetical protein